MDVTCPRCQTDYEFDDALVSERGTTVKCTNCGHQFRVFRPRAGTVPITTQEVWRIDKREGASLELRSLVELQRAIRAGRVGRMDLLRRGDGAPRRVGDIPELEPFFPVARAEGGGPNTMPLPALGDRPPAAPTPAWGRAVSAPIEVHPPPPLKPPSIPPPRTLPQTHTHRPITPPPRPAARAPVEDERVSIEGLLQPEPAAPRYAEQAELPAPPPPSVHRSAPVEDLSSMDALFAHPAPPPRRRVGALIVTLALVAGVGVLGATVGKPYFKRFFAAPTQAASVSGSPTERLARELSAGERAREEGDFASAREAYSRASVVDDKSLAAWDGLCTAESELALAHWVAALVQSSALERDQAASIGSSAGKSCARWSEIARAGEEAKKVATDARPARALAAQGDAAGVRVYLPSHPGDALFGALAILADATKAEPAQIVAAAKAAAPALLKMPISALQSPGDVALAAAIFGLAGQPVRAQEAVSDLGKRAPRHMLLETLRAIGAPAGVADAGASDASVAPSTSGTAVAVSTGPATTTTGAEDTSGDYRSLNEKGHKALAAGEASKAESYFKAALAQHGGDVDALYGLGQIARSKGDHLAAVSYFKQVLDASSGFGPARLALADEQWAAGQQDDAKKNYILYLERVSEGSGADRARTRTGLEKKADPAPESP